MIKRGLVPESIQGRQSGEDQLVQEGDPTFLSEEETEIVAVVPDQPEKTTRVSKELPPEVKKALVSCLIQNWDIFAWFTVDLMGISPEIIEHHLYILPTAHPMKQKRWHFDSKKDKVIKEEVQKLLEVGHIRDVYFPTWLFNVVLESKPSGKWQMYINFRDLNKVCTLRTIILCPTLTHW